MPTRAGRLGAQHSSARARAGTRNPGDILDSRPGAKSVGSDGDCGFSNRGKEDGCTDKKVLELHSG